MSALLTSAILLAERGREGVRDLRLRSTADAQTFLWALVVVVALLAIVVVAMRWRQAREQRHAASPQQLFRDLCRAHQLSWRERRLLTRLADWHQLPHAAHLFLDARRFDADEFQGGRDRAELARLRARLFG